MRSYIGNWECSEKPILIARGSSIKRRNKQLALSPEPELMVHRPDGEKYYLISNCRRSADAERQWADSLERIILFSIRSILLA